jgi:hypothetical protein
VALGPGVVLSVLERGGEAAGLLSCLRSYFLKVQSIAVDDCNSALRCSRATAI